MLLDPGETRRVYLPVLPSHISYSLGSLASQLFLGAVSLKGDIPPNGLLTLCLHFTEFVTYSAQSSIQGSCTDYPDRTNIHMDMHLLVNASLTWRSSSRITPVQIGWKKVKPSRIPACGFPARGSSKSDSFYD